MNDLKCISLTELDSLEMKETNGGFFWLLIPMAYQAALVGGLVLGVLGSFEAGYRAVKE